MTQPAGAASGWRLGAYGLAAGLALPAAAAWAACHPRMRRYLAERLAWRLPAVQPGALWIHAASLGEGQAAAALAQGLFAQRPDLPLIRTATSDTGRQQPLPVDQVGCLPFDLPWLHRRWLRRVRPRALVLVEGELWPGLLSACRGRTPVAVLGLRVGEGTRRLAWRFPNLWRELIDAVDLWTARDDEGAGWLGSWLGCEVPVVGDLKAEAPFASSSLSFERPVVLAGSTRPGDEQALLTALAQLESSPLLVLAPRHEERFDEVADLVGRSGLRWSRRSSLHDDDVPADLEVLLLDTMGELAGLYPLASAAFVGGTFDPTMGGHSAAEAARAGVTVVHGPAIHGNAPSFESSCCVPAANHGELAQALAAALSAPRPAVFVGNAVSLAIAAIEPLLCARVPPEKPHRPWLGPLVPLVRAAAGFRRSRARVAGACPVISVGNIASGGTGKTPVVRSVVALLAARGVRPAVISRGYRRQRAGSHVRDSAEGPADSSWLGDELAMLGRDGTLVVSCPDRHRGVAHATSLGAQVCVLDDGLQQRDVQVDLNIVVVHALHPTAGGVIPVGQAREPLSALERAHLLWVNHGPLPDLVERCRPPGVPVVQASSRPLGWVRDGVNKPLAAGPRGLVAVLSGVAEPAGFLRTLRALGLVPARRFLFPDHHRWDAAELQDIARRAGVLPIVTTEKDAVRLGDGHPCWVLRIDLEIRHGQEALVSLFDDFLAEHGPWRRA